MRDNKFAINDVVCTLIAKIQREIRLLTFSVSSNLLHSCSVVSFFSLLHILVHMNLFFQCLCATFHCKIYLFEWLLIFFCCCYCKVFVICIVFVFFEEVLSFVWYCAVSMMHNIFKWDEKVSVSKMCSCS